MSTKPFTRESHYIVIKRKDAAKYLDDEDRTTLENIGEVIEKGRYRERKIAFECVVVESDWPEYEPTWAAIEARMSRPTAPTCVPEGEDDGDHHETSDSVNWTATLATLQPAGTGEWAATLVKLKAALVGRNQDFGDVAELVDELARHAPRPAVATGEVREVVRTALGTLPVESTSHRGVTIEVAPIVLERVLTAITPFLATPAAPADGEDTKKDAARWNFFASSPQTALMLGSKVDPNKKDFPWREECDRLADAALSAAPTTDTREGKS